MKYEKNFLFSLFSLLSDQLVIMVWPCEVKIECRFNTLKSLISFSDEIKYYRNTW